ncbi:MAG: DUF3048 domain-containing protein [Bacilli bacterium]|nr:DUF3048 domain-containing protein [Bacilli bacterium]
MKNKIIISFMLLVLLLTGCNAKESLNAIKKPIEKLISKEEKKIKIVDMDSKSRPYAVMVNNIRAARGLQSGLQDAYIIYEIIAEGGVTRFLALFMDTDTKRIGSVRSARHYFLDYALENDAIYIHHGYSPQAWSDFYSLGIDRIEINAPKTAWRDTELNVASEHTLFTSIDKISNGIGKIRTERNKDLLLNYSLDTVDLSKLPDSEVANKVEVVYSSSVTNSYEYDEVAKVYKRSVNDLEHKDYMTGKQYTFKNIIVYQVSNHALDNYGRQDLSNLGEKQGYYITNGYAVPIIAQKDSRSGQTVYKYLDGKEIDVSDGNTFIQIQPVGKDLKIEE